MFIHFIFTIQLDVLVDIHIYEFKVKYLKNVRFSHILEIKCYVLKILKVSILQTMDCIYTHGNRKFLGSAEKLPCGSRLIACESINGK